MTTEIDLLGRPPIMRFERATEAEPAPEDWRGEDIISNVPRIPGGLGIHRRNIAPIGAAQPGRWPS